MNIDYQRTFEAVVTLTNLIENEIAKTVITFETPYNIEWRESSDIRQFNPDLFMEVLREDIKVKRDGMGTYKFEKREWPHPRSNKSLRLLSKRWGSMIGTNYAEAFTIIRSISV